MAREPSLRPARPSSSPAEAPQPARIKGRVQQGFLLLREILERAGRPDLAARLATWGTVDDLMLDSPELVPSLLGLAWEMRADAAFGELFKAEEGGAVVDSQDQPIAPCGRTYQQVIHSHLYASTRLAIEQADRTWAVREAKRARARWRKEQATARRSLLKMFRKPREPDFDPAEFRAKSPKRGLYEALKPYLTTPDQFSLAQSYALLTTAHIRVLGDLLPTFTRPEQIAFLAALTEGDVYVLRRCARIYGEWKLGLRRPKRPRPGTEPPPVSEEDEARLIGEEAAIFRELMAHHHAAIEELKVMGPNAERLIDLVAPVFGDSIWSVLGDKQALHNVVNTPEHLMASLGPFCRYVTPAVSEIWLQMNDQEIIVDILKFARETFREKEFAYYLADPSRLVVWSSLPAKFNNNFKYQRDAMKSNLIRNEQDLRTVCAGVFESLRQGKVL
ncbi:hypothetical protein [Pararhodospirillum oryzae]|uniref:Uncharacterized protein n=1 Tax=Pararhodospirillum oryzae TaxID=478448 RepID=A0A512HBZ1_9PROT|nr:hypothetical protein [Pararhodospirillum oryzae]GEO82900.1 hypothetical protein ROR02_30310 [Pararhodospirillum oryzae]